MENIMKILAQKLKSHSLNEVQPIIEKAVVVEDQATNFEGEGIKTDLAESEKEIAEGKMIADDESFANENEFRTTNSNLVAVGDPHSCSEEELESIEKSYQAAAAAEKRKWSQANRRGSYNNENAGSSDDEIRDICKPSPVMFSSLPPNRPHIQRPSFQSKTTAANNNSPKVFLANIAPSFEAVSPRKRHRQTLSEPHTRPSLDFEKMQQKALMKKHGIHGISRARMVKIRSIPVNSGSRRHQPPLALGILGDPAMFSFRPLSTITAALAPVEDPQLAAY